MLPVVKLHSYGSILHVYYAKSVIIMIEIVVYWDNALAFYYNLILSFMELISSNNYVYILCRQICFCHSIMVKTYQHLDLGEF